MTITDLLQLIYDKNHGTSVHVTLKDIMIRFAHFHTLQLPLVVQSVAWY